ncbi:MAG: GntR family transcriptional regulator [Lachnospiraceae bacterium]|nr:GntR family transcriptional regulator [Lachnospiraceae bacterium]
MEIIIRNSSDEPIYGQITQQIKEQIISGKLPAGQMLPSIRGLAKDLKISVITTKRAYDELAAEGFVDNVPGKGFFVAEKDMTMMREARLKEMEEHLAAVVSICKSCAIEVEEAVELLRQFFEEEG